MRKGEAGFGLPDHQWSGKDAVCSQLRAAKALAESDAEFRASVDLMRIGMALWPKAAPVTVAIYS